jgi:cystathionine beta-lyase
MKQETIAVISGKNSHDNSGTVNTPVHRTSTILFPTLKAYHDAENGKDFYNVGDGEKAIDYSYAITGTPTTFALQRAITELEGGQHTLICPSGLSAITTTLLALLSAGDHILMTDSVYGPTRRFCNRKLKRFGIETTYYDPLIGGDIDKLIQDNTKLIFTESPGSLTFEIQDIPAIAKAAHKKGVIVVMDNSWATSLYFKPFKHGVDVSIHAGTKYISGHSDIFLGTITTTDEHIDKIFKAFKDLGNHTSPDVCYMASRGLRTMPTRVQAHEKSALNIAKWMDNQPEVKQVLHPALPSHPGHILWKRDFTGSTGLFSVILDKKYPFEAISAMIDGMELFGIGSSWGGFESLIINFDPSNIRTASKWTETNSCLRIYTGLEAEEDLMEDLKNGLKRLKKY